MNLIKDEEEEEIQLPEYHVQSQPQVVTTMSSQNNQDLENIRQIELDHGSEMADTDTDDEQFHGFNDHEISESADMYLGMDFLIDGQISSFCPGQHEAALLTLVISHKLTQSL